MENEYSAGEWQQISAKSLSFYRPLVAGRAAEYKVYSYIYSQFDKFLAKGIRISIFDQVADIDDVDFCVRLETLSDVSYFDCQVKSSREGIWKLSKGFLNLIQKRALQGMRSVIFLVDSRPEGDIYF